MLTSVDAPTCVATVADSILADGGIWSNFALEGRYERFAFPAEMDRAICGDTSQAILDRLDTVLALSPTVLVAHAGTNDLAATIEPANAIYRRIVTVAARGLAEGIGHVIVVCVLPRRDAYWQTTQFRHRVRHQLNALLRRLPGDPALAAYRGRISVIDLEREFDPRVDTNDGLHPNPAGAEKIGRAIGRELDRLDVRRQPGTVRGALRTIARTIAPRRRGTT